MRIKVLLYVLAYFLLFFRPQQSLVCLNTLVCCVYILQSVFVHLNLHHGEDVFADWRSQMYH